MMRWMAGKGAGSPLQQRSQRVAKTLGSDRGAMDAWWVNVEAQLLGAGRSCKACWI